MTTVSLTFPNFFQRNVYVSDLTEEVIYTAEMALKWITKGESKTMLNSSLQHL